MCYLYFLHKKNTLCMIYKHFDLWGHWKFPHKSPSPRNNFHTRVIIHICYLINTHTERHSHKHTNKHTQTLSLSQTRCFLWFIGTLHMWNVFYTVQTMCYCPTPKASPHRRRCISTFPTENWLCMIYKRFELWWHWKCPHKSPIHVIILICYLINNKIGDFATHTGTKQSDRKSNKYLNIYRKICIRYINRSITYINIII